MSSEESSKEDRALQFAETQTFSWGVFVGGAVFVLLVLLITGWFQPKDEVVIAWSLAIGSLALMAVIWLTLKMEVRVDKTGVHIKTLYFIRRSFPFSEIRNAEAVTYRPIVEYGGWGYRISHNGKAFNMRGNRGVKLTLRSNESVLIGSQKEQVLHAAVMDGMQNDAGS